MVLTSFSEDRTMRSERSKPLHNFTLPCLKWGNQRHLRCMKINSNGFHLSGGVDRRSQSSRLVSESTESRSLDSESESEMRRLFLKDLKKRPLVSKSRITRKCDDGIDAVREKLMFDLKTAADKMKEAIFRDETVAGAGDSAGDVAEARPWNLRTRRAACKAPNFEGEGSKTLKIDVKKSITDSPMKSDGCGKSSPGLKMGPEKKRKAKLVVPLSKREIDDDFMEMLGIRPPRRPKKRNRIVQKQLDTLFPGLWLSEITADLYKVTELPENGKR